MRWVCHLIDQIAFKWPPYSQSLDDNPLKDCKSVIEMKDHAKKRSKCPSYICDEGDGLVGVHIIKCLVSKLGLAPLSTISFIVVLVLVILHPFQHIISHTSAIILSSWTGLPV